MMKIGRIVDLSHNLYPGREEYGLKIETRFTDEVLPGYKRRKDIWYILQNVTMSSHVGTHIEFPYHHLKDGQDAFTFPVEKLIGEAILLDFSSKKNDEAIDINDLKKYGKKIKRGDIVFIRTGRDKFYRTEHSHQRPYLTHPAVKWLVEKKINCLGIDATGLEIKGTDNQPNHTTLFENGIPLIESMANLDRLKKKRFLVFILPLPIKGLDSSPVRIIAIEKNG